MFEIKKVSKQYNGEYALDDVSLNIGKGFNFIVGASGSGKTTLLKIISGMEQSFDGDVLYCGKSIKSLTSNEKSYFYNNVFGFIWQDFNLLEDSTVLENVLLPTMLKENLDMKRVEKILKDLKIYKIASQKVRYLSGGQKQRVAIARELMKNPQVIIADEPTSALDEKTSKSTMNILRTLSKNTLVIVVTHDTSLIMKNDHVYELDKGELISKVDVEANHEFLLDKEKTHSLCMRDAFTCAFSNIKNKKGRFLISTLTLVIASILLLTTIGGGINNNTQSEFDQLFNTYGDSLNDISIVKGFTDGASTDGKGNNKPNGEVSQNIEGLYDLFMNDKRVEFISYLQAFDDIEIKVDDRIHKIASSGNMPSINELIAGEMPVGKGKQVVVPQSFVKKLGISNDQAIGKEIEFKGTIVDWTSGNPIWKETSTVAKIVAVMDTTIKTEMEGEVFEYQVDDSFLFSKDALEQMVTQIGMDMNNMSFLLRANSPADTISIKDELSKKGIVPIGRFELIEDLVRLNDQSTTQSGSSSIIIGILSIVMIISIFSLTTIMRSKEMAIYKITGFTKKHLFLLSLAEIVFIALGAIIFILITSPLLNKITEPLFGLSLLNSEILMMGVLFIVITSTIAYFTTLLFIAKVKTDNALKSGERT